MFGRKIEINVEKDKEVEIELGIATVVTNKHNELINRDLEDQHPIKAITGLESELDKKMEGESIGNAEILNLFR